VIDLCSSKLALHLGQEIKDEEKIKEEVNRRPNVQKKRRPRVKPIRDEMALSRVVSIKPRHLRSNFGKL
jgi:hypothetical protein